MRSIELQEKSIVLLGKLNPSIFQPNWFSQQGLISLKESENAKITVIHQDIVSFDLDWVNILITRERCSFTSLQELFEPLRDLAFGTFKILKHTPLSQMGINHRIHCKFESEEKWHELGHKLAPKEIWNTVLDKPGMKSLTIMQSVRTDGYKGAINVTVEPSLKIPIGIFIGINDHYEIENKENPTGSDEIMNILSNNWASSLENSIKIFNKIIKFDD